MISGSPRHDAYDAHIEEIRKTEYPGLLETTYLDHAGTTLYAKSLIDAYHKDLTSNIYGNPHSESPASWLSTQRVDEARQAVLKYFNADPEHFDVVFCANATAAIKIVADCFRDQRFWYGYHKDAHNSLVGVREVASESRCFTSNLEVEQYFQGTDPGLRLFAYPAQSNMTGYRPPYAWARQIRSTGTYVLLDAASYLTSGRLDLGDVDVAPDFIALSFYKIFGYPDLGALIVRRSAFNVLTRRKYFGGGTVELVTVIGGSSHESKKHHIHDFLEDGTLPFHNIIALKHAIEVQKRIFGTREDISQHTAHLSGWLYHTLKSLRHANGLPVMELYKDKNATYGDTKTQGPILSFNIWRADRTFIGKSHFEKLAISCGFQIRTGGVCNPGGVASMVELEHWELRRNFTEGVSCGDDKDIIGGKPTGIIRVSLGAMSTMSDVTRFVDFVKHFFVEREVKAAKAVTLPTSIFPVEGCAPFEVEDFVPYQPFDRAWCIIDTKSGKVVKSSFGGLKVGIDVKREKLVFNDSFQMGLWDVPETTDKDRRSKPWYRTYEVYTGEVNRWLTETLGFQCALARYNHEDHTLSPAATTCVICGLRTFDKTGLYKHYEDHAHEFLRARSFRRETVNATPNLKSKMSRAASKSMLRLDKIFVTRYELEKDEGQPQVTIVAQAELDPRNSAVLKQQRRKPISVLVHRIMGRGER
ncbi:hypothetical protein LTR05_007889 [Lithohypha guttulata]|uniref:Aminotransferase class V domain-containing protein n=1 Tax=Lithohypha guttulata TaxID=1690604 RepID=A0AAN7SUE4_9EURO|nr:hypothetical protein LTR05_007889 [Lithohypha guttulata]